jgi:hypothetical protein
MSDDPAQSKQDVLIRSSEITEEELMRRRKTNRECMRRRRADPGGWACAQEERKNLAIRREQARHASAINNPAGRKSVCAICRVRTSIEEVIRLEPCASLRSGYKQIRIPYCGRC